MPNGHQIWQPKFWLPNFVLYQTDKSVPSTCTCVAIWMSCYRNHFVLAPSQWEMTLRCNVVSHWLSGCTKLSLPLTSHISLALGVGAAAGSVGVEGVTGADTARRSQNGEPVKEKPEPPGNPTGCGSWQCKAWVQNSMLGPCTSQKWHRDMMPFILDNLNKS